jgi:hypothetical protein
MERRPYRHSALPAILRRFQSGNLEAFIKTWQPSPGQRVVLCCRVSGRTQDKRGNLADQESQLRHVANRHGVFVVGVVEYVGSGYDPCWLARAADIAKQRDATLVAECTNRFVRHAAYQGEGWLDDVAREVELEELRFCTDGVPLATLVPPGEVSRGALIKRGQRYKDRRGGRPPAHPRGWWKYRRAELLPDVLQMRRAGATYGAIGKALKLPKETVARHQEQLVTNYGQHKTTTRPTRPTTATHANEAWAKRSDKKPSQLPPTIGSRPTRAGCRSDR